MEKKWFLLEGNCISEIVHDTYENVRKLRKVKGYSSMSYGYDTEENLIFDERISDKRCKHCGAHITFMCSTDTERHMKANEVCFTCSFWLNKAEDDKNRKNGIPAIIDGSHYIIMPDNPNAAFRGFGGHEFIILFKTGETIITHNLWHQGTIPPHFRNLLPDNAKFINL